MPSANRILGINDRYVADLILPLLQLQELIITKVKSRNFGDDALDAKV